MVRTPEDDLHKVTISPARLEANRENAKKPTGPRTNAGKAVSRRNATSHSILVSSAVLRDGPDAEPLRALYESLCDELTPVRELERCVPSQPSPTCGASFLNRCWLS